MSFAAMMREEARLIVLQTLAEEAQYSLGETLLQARLDSHGISRSREWVREELRRLADLGAVSLTDAGTALIATLNAKGRDHVERRLLIEGVKRPSPPE